MLLRLCNYHAMNPHLIDKLIVIRGLPKEWIFKKVAEGDQLLPPWEADVDANIPESIRHICTPITYVKWFHPVRHYDQTYQGFWDKRTVLGLKLDFSFGPAQEMWEKVTDYVNGILPRTERMMEPVLVAPDQKSLFDPHLCKRNAQGALILVKSEIPVVDLAPYQSATAVSAPAPVVDIKTVILASGFNCPSCDFKTDRPKSLRMHTMKKHPVKEKVAV